MQKLNMYCNFLKHFCCISAGNSIVPGLKLRSLMHLGFICLSSKKLVSHFILLHTHINFCQHYLLRKLSFLQCMIWELLSKISYVCGPSRQFNCLTCPFSCQLHTGLITVTLQYALKSDTVISHFIFPVRIALASLVLL